MNILNSFCSFRCCVCPVLIRLTDSNKGVQNINENSGPGVDVDDVFYATGWNGMECFVNIYACVRCVCVCLCFAAIRRQSLRFGWQQWVAVRLATMSPSQGHCHLSNHSIFLCSIFHRIRCLVRTPFPSISICALRAISMTIHGTILPAEKKRFRQNEKPTN